MMQAGDCGIRQVILEIDDVDRFLLILKSLGERTHTHIIIFNSEMMAGRKHVTSALSHAIRADTGKRRISNRLEMEALLYASGSRQCINGMKFGVHAGTNRSYLCLCPWKEPAWSELSKISSPCSDDWDTISSEKARLLMDLFEITSVEVEAAGGIQKIRDLVLERVALLDAYR
jgi:KEOPS complex subunit Cgi121